MSAAGKKIAIVGSGISGLVCAYLLAKRNQVSVFEAANEIGGHTATKRVCTAQGNYDIDTGFIVFNDRTYPNFMRLLSTLGVAYQPTEMGFSVSCRRTAFEYAGTSVNGLFAQRKNVFSVEHWRMLLDIARFNKDCIARYEQNALPEGQTLGEFLSAQGYSQRFRDFYILPMVSAIWSSSLETAAAMPLVFFIRFFYNHGLLTVTQQPQWYTIIGGSNKYLGPLTESFKESIFTNCPITRVERLDAGVRIVSKQFGEQDFDEVIFACHSDQALQLLTDASAAESDILGAIPYAPNQVVLHSDTSVLPRAGAAWASWNYLLPAQNTNEAVLTYNMNILQRLISAEVFCVSVNAGSVIDPTKVYGTYNYSHPMFTLGSLTAQSRWGEISGHRHTHFCGAYWRNGFHEDGVVSAIRVAAALGEIW